MATTTATPETQRLAHQQAIATAPLGPGDYCDACRVGHAVARATINGVGLHFCGHHLRRHRDALEGHPAVVLHVQDGGSA